MTYQENVGNKDTVYNVRKMEAREDRGGVKGASTTLDDDGATQSQVLGSEET